MEYVIEYLEAELDSLKYEYRNSDREDEKRLYSERVLEVIKAIKILKAANDPPKENKQKQNIVKAAEDFRDALGLPEDTKIEVYVREKSKEL